MKTRAFGLDFHTPDDLDPMDEITYRYGGRAQTLRYDVQRRDTVVEIGAFCGLHAMRLTQKVGPSGTVLAVEMIPEYAALCRLNSTWNHLDIAVGEYAVGDSNGISIAAIDHHQRNSLPGGIVDQDGSRQRDMPVITKTLDETLVPYLVVDLLTLQVNGTEVPLLRAATCWEKIRNLAIATRYWHGSHQHQWFKPFSCPPIIRLLQDQGYEVEEIDTWVYAWKRT